MERSTKLAYNSIFGLLHHFVAIICGFILPRYILQAFGSDVNGLVSSITSFLGFITLAECGVGAVVQSALYKPLAEKDNEQISRIIISAERFFRKIAALLLLYTVGLFLVYPYLVIDKFDFFYTASLIVVVSIASLAQYYFSITYRLLLTADQMSFVPVAIQTIALILNTVFSVILIKLGFGIHAVKFVSSLIFLLQPCLIIWYVNKHYTLDKTLKLQEEPIKQKWNGMAQHIAAFILGNTDIVVLTAFSTLSNVSIYTVYNLVVAGILNFILAGTNGFMSLLGNMYAKQEKKLVDFFSLFEWGVHNVSIVLFIITGFLIIPFVKLYTLGVNDTDYVVPLFSILICIGQGIRALRMIYNTMVLAAGHYKETQFSAIIEAILNIFISIVLVYKFGLIGVAIGTLFAMSYRTYHLARYLSKNILYRSMLFFYKQILVDVICILVIVLVCNNVFIFPYTYLEWMKSALVLILITIPIVLIVNLIFYRKNFIKIYRRFRN